MAYPQPKKSQGPVKPYVPLWVKSNFSFLQGASHPEELMAEARQLGLPAVALTDCDGVYGAVRAHVAAREHGQRLILGTQLTVADVVPAGLSQALPANSLPMEVQTTANDSKPLRSSRIARGHTGVALASNAPLTAAAIAQMRPQTPLLLAMNRQGWGNLCRLITLGRRRAVKGSCVASWQELAEHNAGLLLLIHRAPTTVPISGRTSAPSPHLQLLAEAFGDRAYALTTRHRHDTDASDFARLRATAAALKWPLVAGTEVLYHTPTRRTLQDVLTAVRNNTSLDQAGDRLRANGEHELKTPYAMAELFHDLPDALRRTLDVASRCAFNLNELRYVYPAEDLPNGTTLDDWLRQLTERGACQRYCTSDWASVPADVRAQIDKELGLIRQLDYGGYFLTMWEIVQFCLKSNILCQGRGSAANSTVCYCLGITAIDPVRMGLLFERFLSVERAEPPDIDLDIEHDRREEVIQYVYGRYDPLHPAAKNYTESASCVVERDRSHASMVAVVIRYRAKSAIRDVGKALGLTETALDRLSKLVSRYGDGMSADDLRLAGLDPETPTHQLLCQLTAEIQDFPRHLSIHPGGFLLGHDPVDSIVPIENGTMENRTVIQWDKDDVEALGLFKVDLLGLGMLSQVHRCFDLLRQGHNLELTMATVPAEDPATYAMIQKADTVGVFQIESRAQMSMLPRLRPRTFYDLVVEVAIIRPGPITGGMVHPYLRRRHGEEPVIYPHPCLIPVLEKTMGVPLFQEQVMKLAMVAADYSAGEADQLRRDMAAWRRSGRIEQHRDRLVERMAAKGIDREFAERVFEQIRGFGEYGFPESHAASFALISYVTAWLKCHYPAEFTCALLNAWPMGFYTPATLIEDAKRHGVVVLPVDVQRSQWECWMEPHLQPHLQPQHQKQPLAVRMGYRFAKGLGVLHRVKLEAAPPPYVDLTDFVRRVPLDRAALEGLAEAGAFDGLGLQRREALWQMRAILRRVKDALPLSQRDDLPLLAPLSQHAEVVWDYRRVQHSARGHPLQHVRRELQERQLPTAAQVQAMPDGRRVRYAGLVICRQRPGTAKGVTFFTLEDETGFVNLVLWRDVYENNRLLAKTAALMGVTGKVQAKDGVTHVIVEELWELALGQAVPATGSRDFH